MKIYNYDGATREYLNEGAADPDPLQEGEWLIPANATIVQPPPAVAKRAAVFDPTTEKWAYVADYRGVEVEANDNSGRTTVIGQLGVKPEDVRFEPLTNEQQVKTQVTQYLSVVMDYLIAPTEEKKQQLIEMYQEVTQGAA